MAIRIRKIDGRWIALCAARSMPKEGDVYLDDAIHYALTEKFARDFNYGLYHNDEVVERLVEREESNNPNREWWDQTYGTK